MSDRFERSTPFFLWRSRESKLQAKRKPLVLLQARRSFANFSRRPAKKDPDGSEGVEGLCNVVVIGASNRPDLIDPAILRPGENEDLPNTSNPDDWAKIAGRKGERIVVVKSLVGLAPQPQRNVEKVITTGQYL